MAPKLAPRSTLPVIYVSGPMSGRPDFNFPAFNEMSRRLRAFGFPVLNPADFGADPKHTWADCLRRDIATLGHAEAVVLLEGYEASKGAALELDVARGLGLRIVEPDRLSDFLLEFFDREPLCEFVADDSIRQSATFFRICDIESDDYELIREQDRRRRAAYAKLVANFREDLAA